MPLTPAMPYDVTRCLGSGCAERFHCRRFTDPADAYLRLMARTLDVALGRPCGRRIPVDPSEAA